MNETNQKVRVLATPEVVVQYYICSMAERECYDLKCVGESVTLS